jgi:hypothetical protein
LASRRSPQDSSPGTKSLYVHLIQVQKYTPNCFKVAGNYVDGVAIAGQVQIAQFSLEANSGMIKSLDTDGKITLEGGQVVRINDPNAVFSAGYTSRPEFTADDVNPSVTGMPSIATAF